MKNQLIIIGASGHGKVVADIAKKIGYTSIKFLDDDTNKKKCDKYNVVGSMRDIIDYKECDFIVAIGNNLIRKMIQEKLSEIGVNIVTLIHPSAVLAENVKIGEGTIIAAGVVINTSSWIGKGCIINTGATIDHDNVIADYVHVSVGSHLAGTVKVDAGVMIGAGTTIINNISICKECVIGAGAVVIDNVEKKGTYVGVPARWIK